MMMKAGIVSFLFLIALPFHASSQSQNIAEKSEVNATNKNLDSLYQVLHSKFDDLEKENKELKADFMQQRIDKANTIINWSAMMFTILAILLVIAGGIGLREFSRIRQIEDSMKEKLDQVNQVLKTIAGHKAIIGNELEKAKQYGNEIAEELENFKSQKDKILENTKKFIELSFYLNSGRQAYHSGDYFKSIELLSKALDMDPKNIQALSFLGDSLLRAEKKEQAFAIYKQILSLDDQIPEGYVGMALLYFDSDKHKALEYCDKALQIEPKSAVALNLKGHIYRKLDLFDEAIEAHLDASRIKSDFESYFFIAFNYYAKADLENAHKYFRKAHYHAQETIEKSYRNHWAYFVIGVIEGIEGKTDKARSCLVTSLGLNNTGRVRTMMKNDLLFLQRYATEESVLKEVDLLISYLGDDI